MKHSHLFTAFIILALSTISCRVEVKPLTIEEKDKIKKEVFSAYRDHIEHLLALDYQEMMKFYPDEHIIYGDGEYWGDYETIDQIWKQFTDDVQKMLKWEVDDHQIFVHSKDAASYLVEFVNWRIESKGDTTKVHGSFSFGMQKYPDGWKAATQNVTHHYTAGPWVKK